MTSEAAAAVSDRLVVVADTLVITLLVVLWLVFMVLFWRRWKRFSLLGPRVLDVYQQPKNLESVTVVSRPVDSVIYNSYSKHVVSAIQVHRQSRLQKFSLGGYSPGGLGDGTRKSSSEVRPR